jgi:hypothetical protein
MRTWLAAGLGPKGSRGPGLKTSSGGERSSKKPQEIRKGRSLQDHPIQCVSHMQSGAQRGTGTWPRSDRKVVVKQQLSRHMPVISALRRPRQENREFEVSPGYIMSS